MKNKSNRKIIVRTQTADEEFYYLKNIFSKIDYYNENGYKNLFPDNPFFLNISNNLDLLEKETIREFFKKEVYDSVFF